MSEWDRGVVFDLDKEDGFASVFAGDVLLVRCNAVKDRVFGELDIPVAEELLTDEEDEFGGRLASGY